MKHLKIFAPLGPSGAWNPNLKPLFHKLNLYFDPGALNFIEIRPKNHYLSIRKYVFFFWIFSGQPNGTSQGWCPEQGDWQRDPLPASQIVNWNVPFKPEQLGPGNYWKLQDEAGALNLSFNMRQRIRD